MEAYVPPFICRAVLLRSLSAERSDIVFPWQMRLQEHVCSCASLEASDDACVKDLLESFADLAGEAVRVMQCILGLQ